MDERTRWKKLPLYRIVGFCLLARREVIDKIGGLDEQFGSGNFEDDDFCMRAALAGYEARVAQDVYIHHTGGQTFKGAGIDFQKSLSRNWKLFKTKWRIPVDTLHEYLELFKTKWKIPVDTPSESGFRFIIHSGN